MAKQSIFSSSTASHGRLVLLLLFSLFVLSGCNGCGSEEIATDPAQTGQDSPFDELETEAPADRPFEDTGGSAFDNSEDVDSSDLDAAAIESQLEDIFFNYDRFDLDSSMRDILASNARVLEDNPKADLLIEGHCDERGTAQYNMALGWKRANEAQRYLFSLGVDEARIETVSYGKEKPFVVGNGQQVWSQNRRAHFVVRERR